MSEAAAEEIVSSTDFGEFYAGLASSQLHACSFSQHFIPSGCMAAPALARIAERIRRANARLTVVLNSTAARDAWRGFIADEVRLAEDVGAHSVVVAHPAILAIAREVAPQLRIHVSSLAGITNLGAMRFWNDIGADRVILPRAMSSGEVTALAASRPPRLEVEAFISGGGCAFTEHSCNLPHFIFEEDARVAELGADAVWACVHRPGCQSPVEVVFPDGHAEFQLLHPGYRACGTCYAAAFLGAGVSALKVTGRTRRPDVSVREAVALSAALRDLAGGAPASSAAVRACSVSRDECLYGKEDPDGRVR